MREKIHINHRNFVLLFALENLPKCIIRLSIIRQIRECSLIDVKDPNIPAILGETEALGILISGISRSITILTVLVAEHVVSNIVFTGLGNQVPFTDVVSFHGQTPTEAGNARNVVAGSARMRFKKVDLVRNSLGCCYQGGKEEEH
jgi:hypothetical protein